MLGEYPIIVDGQETGTLRVSKDGIMTVFDARCRDPGFLLRLYVFGEKEAYLGVMAPDGSGDLHLHKRLSRAALAGFPVTIRYAGVSEVREEALKTEAQDEPEKIAETQIRWRHGAGGALVGSRAENRYLAIPIKTGVVPVGSDFQRQTIDDTEYAVFEIKNANIN